MSQVNYVLPINQNFDPELQESTGGVTGCGGTKSSVQGYSLRPTKGGSRKRKRYGRKKSIKSKISRKSKKSHRKKRRKSTKHRKKSKSRSRK